MIVFLDTEFTNLDAPALLSIGAVTLDGREHYVELDMATDIGQARLNAASDFVRYDGVLDLFGLVPGASVSYEEIGRRTGEWLLAVAAEDGGAIELAYDYPTDYVLTERALRDGGLQDRVRAVLTPIFIGAVLERPEAECAADDCFRGLESRGLARHHALADALALRAAFVACSGRS